MAKKRIYEIAKEFEVSSEALLKILREMDVEVKSHMSSVDEKHIKEVRKRFDSEKEAVKEAYQRKRERQRSARKNAAAARKAPAAPAEEPAKKEDAATKKKAAPKETPVKKVEPKAAPTAPKKKAPEKKAPAAPAPPKSPEPVAEQPKPAAPAPPKPSQKPAPPKREAAQAPPSRAKRPGRKADVPPPPGKRGKRVKKRSRVVDEKTVRESIKKTLANLDIGKKKRRRRKAPAAPGQPAAPEEQSPTIQVTELATVAEVAAALDVDPSEVIAKCMELGLMVTMNRRLDRDTIETLADEFEHEVEFLSEYGESMEEVEEVNPENLRERPPVVTIMGHVDHGKTSLLDYIRKTNVIAGEVGGITQHIGAYEVSTKEGSITFLDTPGHEAFSAMRARGAQVTDIVVLVVAADDQVMPQTIEAIDHAKAASVPVIVAINKMDRPEANPMRIKQQLAERGLQVEEWGGKVVAVEVSAQTGDNIDKLLEMILLEAELLELKADPKARARGTVIESRLEPGRGVVTTTLVQNGTLKVGDPFIAGSHSGRVRALFDERGKPKKLAGPSSAVEILGASSAPQAGDSFTVFPSEKDAKEVAAKRQQQLREQSLRYQKRMSLDDLFDQIQQGGLQTLNIVLKGDVDGSVEAVTDTLQKLSTSDVKVDVIHKGVGTISESDILLAAASNAIIIGFHAKADTKAAKLAEKEGVDIRFYQIIYEAVDDIRLAMEGLLTPESHESVTGRVEVRQIFRIGRTHVVAGSYVTSGTVTRNSRIRVLREDTTIYEGKIQSLKRFKDDAREVKEGFECGITLENFNDIQEGDILEAFEIKEVARKL